MRAAPAKWLIGIVLAARAIPAWPEDGAASAEAARAVEAILAAGQPPPGVVFEIVTGEEDGLEWALPLVRDHVRRLRARYPGLPVAVVSHGEEMFGLAEEAAGAFAGWRGLAPEDFVEEVDVAAAGPAQVNDYRALGWTVIRITDDD